MNRIKIYTDESVGLAIPKGLRRRGVEVWSSHEVGNQGLTDEEQFIYAIEHQAAIFTHDDDFLSLASSYIAEDKTHYGVIYAHPLRVTIGDCIRGIKIIVDIMTPEEMMNQIKFL